MQETEGLLLQILPVVPTDYLAAVTTGTTSNTELANDAHTFGKGRHGSTGSSRYLNNKTGVEYWQQYPLTSADSIRRWQQDCAEGKPSQAARPSRDHHLSSEVADEAYDSLRRAFPTHSTDAGGHVSSDPNRPLTFNTSTAGLSSSDDPPSSTWSQPTFNASPTVLHHSPPEDASQKLLDPPLGPAASAQSFYTSDFQKQFFW